MLFTILLLFSLKITRRLRSYFDKSIKFNTNLKLKEKRIKKSFCCLPYCWHLLCLATLDIFLVGRSVLCSQTDNYKRKFLLNYLSFIRINVWRVFLWLNQSLRTTLWVWYIGCIVAYFILICLCSFLKDDTQWCHNNAWPNFSKHPEILHFVL